MNEEDNATGKHVNKECWYAIKVYYNRAAAIEKLLQEKGIQTYRQSIIPSLLFARTTETAIIAFRQDRWSELMVYTDPKKRPAPVDDKQMETFIMITTASYEGLIYLGDDLPEYHVGDKVRVTDGPFKGAEGHVKRIKKDRRLIISINGVAAVATSFIHPKFLEKVE